MRLIVFGVLSVLISCQGNTDKDKDVQNKIKDVHLATGYVTVSFVVSETGSVGQVAIVKSAGEGAQKERVADAKTAERMDSIAYEVVKNLPDFTPAKWKGKAIEFRLYVKLRFQE